MVVAGMQDASICRLHMSWWQIRIEELRVMGRQRMHSLMHFRMQGRFFSSAADRLKTFPIQFLLRWPLEKLKKYDSHPPAQPGSRLDIESKCTYLAVPPSALESVFINFHSHTFLIFRPLPGSCAHATQTTGDTWATLTLPASLAPQTLTVRYVGGKYFRQDFSFAKGYLSFAGGGGMLWGGVRAKASDWIDSRHLWKVKTPKTLKPQTQLFRREI